MHIECPIDDHRGNGKIERLIRNKNERLRTNKQIVLQRDHSGLSEILFALRMYPTRNGKSPYEKYVGIKPNTIKKLVTSRELPISDSSEEVKLSPSDFESGQDSTIFVRERVRGTKLENVYKKRKGTLLDQSQHTITFLPAGKTQETIISKRDIAKANITEQQQPIEIADEQPCSSKEADRRLNQLRKQMAKNVDMANTGELANQDELTNHSNPSLSLDNTTHSADESDKERPTKQVEEPKAPTTTKSAIKQLKDKIRKQQKKKKVSSLPTIQENTPVIDLTESDDEEEEMAQEEQVKIKQERQEETSSDDSSKNTTRTNLPPRRDTIQERRRGERNRQKTDFFGHNVMVTKIDGPRTAEQPEKTKELFTHPKN